jgi:hypothetical protein
MLFILEDYVMVETVFATLASAVMDLHAFVLAAAMLQSHNAIIPLNVKPCQGQVTLVFAHLGQHLPQLEHHTAAPTQCVFVTYEFFQFQTLKRGLAPAEGC